jgi:hypothetical protein
MSSEICAGFLTRTLTFRAIEVVVLAVDDFFAPDQDLFPSTPHRPEKMFGMLIAILHLNRIADGSGFACKRHVPLIASLRVAS